MNEVYNKVNKDINENPQQMFEILMSKYIIIRNFSVSKRKRRKPNKQRTHNKKEVKIFDDMSQDLSPMDVSDGECIVEESIEESPRPIKQYNSTLERLLAGRK